MNVRGGYAFKSIDYLDAQNGVALIRQSELKTATVDICSAKHLPHEYLATFGDSYKVEKGDILVGLSGSLSSVSVYKDERPALQNQRTGLLQASPLISKKYVLYAYLSIITEIERAGKGVAVQNVSPKQIEALVIPLPPVEEQEGIVEAIESYFTRLDDAVATLERVQRNLTRFRASVLKAAVEGRLVPTEAELARAEGRDYEPASVLLERILAGRRRHWEEAELAKMTAKGKPPKDDRWKAKYREPAEPEATELPELPEGWCWATPEQICETIVDCPHSTPKWSASGCICVRTTEFHPGFLDLSGARYVSNEIFLDRIKRLRPREGDILYSREGGILGIACSVPPGVGLCMGQRMMLLRPESSVPNRYLMLVLNSPFTLARVRNLAGGSASPHVNVGSVRSFPVPLPPEREASRIVNHVNQMSSVENALSADMLQGSSRVQRLRQAILKWAFEGKLVDQDPSDEPAIALLDRISAERETVAARTKTRGRRKAGPA